MPSTHVCFQGVSPKGVTGKTATDTLGARPSFIWFFCISGYNLLNFHVCDRPSQPLGMLSSV